MIHPPRSSHQRISSPQLRKVDAWRICRLRQCTFALLRCYWAAIHANTQATSSSLSAGRASGMGEPQGGVGESF